MMVVDQLRDYLEHGNVANAVNFPQRGDGARIGLPRGHRQRQRAQHARPDLHRDGAGRPEHPQHGQQVARRHGLHAGRRGQRRRRRRCWPRSGRIDGVLAVRYLPRPTDSGTATAAGATGRWLAKWRQEQQQPEVEMPHAFANTLKTFKTASGKSGQVLLAAGAGRAVSQDRPPARVACASCWSRCCATATATRSRPSTCGRWPTGIPTPTAPKRFPSWSRAWCCRTSPACRCWPTWPRCAAWRRGWARRAGAIEPLVPVDLVVDHSIMVDHYGTKDALDLNMKLEFQRNRERYEFMKWGMQAFEHLRRGAARLRHRAPGEPGVPGARRAQGRRRRATIPIRWWAPTATPR